MVEAVAQKDLQLQLLLALDEARDAIQENDDPASMFRAITRLLKNQFHADACAVMLLDDLGKHTELITAHGLPEARAFEMCWQAVSLKQPGALHGVDWTHTLAVQVILDKHPLGSVVLCRASHPFGAEEVDLLTLAESQLDSAILQARMIWKLAQRNRELEAIYQIDRLRDTRTSETDLISNFTNILVEYFKADLCMVLVSHIDTGELILRGVVGKHNAPMSALEAIRDLVTNVHLPQVIPTPPGIEQLTLLAAPFIVAGIHLGAVVVGRESNFNAADQRLMHAVISQMDSAIVHSRVTQQLTQRNRELEAIYRIDHIRDKEAELDGMLHTALVEICSAVSSELGYLMLYNQHSEDPLELKASTVEGLLTSPVYYEVITRVSREALDTGKLICYNRPDGPIRSIIAIPLIVNEKIIGVFGTVNSSNPRGFNAEDQRMLAAITSQIDTAIFERLERRRMRRVLSRSVDPKVLEHLLQRADDHVLLGERVTLSMIFADLRGSTEWAERTDPETLVFALNTFLGQMTEVIFQHGGTLDKFVGDEVIALFGVPVPMEDHAYQAVRTAVAMREAHAVVQAELAERGIELPEVGIGISTGEVIAGEIGTPVRTEFTALGRSMNLGARLCSVAGAGQIYISQNTYDALGTLIEAERVTHVALKGLGEVPVYELMALR